VSGTLTVGFYAAGLPSVVKKGNEYVVVKNTGKVQINLKGWTITTKANKVLKLPTKVLAPGASVRVHPGTGKTTTTDIYLKRGASFNDKHDLLRLRDLAKVVVASRSY
jgi:P pilus assembly chaperone PapD